MALKLNISLFDRAKICITILNKANNKKRKFGSIAKIEILSETSKTTRIIMSIIMKNLVVLMEPSEDAYDISLKGGNMNRFCIDEDTAFELSGVNHLKNSYREMTLDAKENQSPKQSKGKGVFILTI